jgi:hypothetical protein
VQYKRRRKKQIIPVRHTKEEFDAYHYQIHWIQTEKKKKRFNHEITDLRDQKYRKKDIKKIGFLWL